MPKATNRVGLYEMVFEYAVWKCTTLQNLLPAACRGIAMANPNIFNRLDIIGVMAQAFELDVSPWWLLQLYITLAVSPGDHPIRTVLTEETSHAACTSRGVNIPDDSIHEQYAQWHNGAEAMTLYNLLAELLIEDPRMKGCGFWVGDSTCWIYGGKKATPRSMLELHQQGPQHPTRIL